MSKLKLRSTILDGEVVAVDENGIPRFQLLQRFQKQSSAPTLYYAFDVLRSDGSDITGKPVSERKMVLEHIVNPVTGIQLGSYIEEHGKALFELTKEKGMEGIIAKRKDSRQLLEALSCVPGPPDPLTKNLGALNRNGVGLTHTM